MSITIDTCTWIEILDTKDQEDVSDLLDFCVLKKIPIHSSTRVFNIDTVKMNKEQVSNLKEIFTNYNVIEDPAYLRLDVSPLDGVDYFGGKCDKEKEFINVFGKDPVELDKSQTGKKLSNWIGDYDALKHHYINGREIFVTNDSKIYFSEESRSKALDQLGIIILSPKDTYNKLK
jgi:hypothetical protein